MSTASAVRRRALGTVAIAAIAVALTACGGDVDVALPDHGAVTGSASTSKASDATVGPGADDPSAPATKSPSPKATVPPGDPGPDAPGTDDPNGDLGNETTRPHPKDAKTSVPRTAVLDTVTVASVAGGAWTSAAAPADSCSAPRPATAVGTRSTQLSGTGGAGAIGSQIVETVSTHHGDDAAVSAVRALKRRLTTACHATSAPDPRIGDASVQLTLSNADGTVTVVTAAAVEGVTFVLSGSGPATGADTWSALTDIALGSTCVAAMDGCH